MRPDQFSCFIDPETRVPLRLDQPSIVDGHVVSGALVDPSGGERFRIRNGIARFVPSTNYVQNFGLQWKIHSRTQLDSHNGSTYSRDRWKEVSGWDDDLRGKNILEAGSGAGRFTEVLASTGADVYSFDFSEAVEANRENNGHFPNLNVFQADVYRIPLAKGSFDHVFCLGVIQHTPDPALTFQCLASMLKPGGRLAIDVYVKRLAAMLHWKYVMRPLTKRMSPAALYAFVNWYAPKLMPLARVMHAVGGRAGRRLVPILDQQDKRVSREVQRDWTILDTYDALGPAYDQPQTFETVRRWFDEAGFRDVEMFRGPIGGGGLCARGVKI